jgi:Arc/MetJ-type ribon-helix-helix transcriptional regulator
MCAFSYMAPISLDTRFELVRKSWESFAVLKCKTRIVSFRLSEEEFYSFRKVCVSEDFGSVSELIRAAVHELIANRLGCSAEALRAAVERLHVRMEEVGRDVKELKTSPAETIP